MKPMKLTETTAFPKSTGWIGEPKYDGYRCLVSITDTSVELISRNGRLLNHAFPEVVSAFEERRTKLSGKLPIVLDGELVCLLDGYASHFPAVQTRSRMSNVHVIEKEMLNRPCQWIAFDILNQPNVPYRERRKQLLSFCKRGDIPVLTPLSDVPTLGVIESTTDIQALLTTVKRYNGEGIVLKKQLSPYSQNVRSKDWLKLKHYRFVPVLVTFFDATNGYFHGSVYHQQGELNEVAIFKHGLSPDDAKTLANFFRTKGTAEKNGFRLNPSIVVELACIGLSGGQLREVSFVRFLHHADPDDITMATLFHGLYPLPDIVETTSLDKPLWEQVTKADYLHYLQAVMPFMLPFLYQRALTVIRYPHGTFANERFYQKHIPSYAPAYVNSAWLEDICYILCNNPETLIWLGNQLALELHIPFQTIESSKPDEIVFDLDPPSQYQFVLAQEAALDMKQIFTRFQLPFFCKTTGGKGLQVHIPLQKQTLTYEETGRFMKFVADFLCQQKPGKYTTERLKKKRRNRLYIDYVQHAYNKTVIAPYSMRETGFAAVPLREDELASPTLSPQQFSHVDVLRRIQQLENPFVGYERERVSKERFFKLLDEIGV